MAIEPCSNTITTHGSFTYCHMSQTFDWLTHSATIVAENKHYGLVKIHHDSRVFQSCSYVSNTQLSYRLCKHRSEKYTIQTQQDTS